MFEKKNPTTKFWVVVLYFISGAVGLSYEVIWIRKLGLIFGNTIFAITAVLSAFFGGLAIGNFVFGTLSSLHYRKDGSSQTKDHGTQAVFVTIYGLLESCIGAFAFIFPFSLNISERLFHLFYQSNLQNYVFLTFIRFTLFIGILLIPTTMMGGTLPMLSQYLITSHERLGKSLGLLYGLNTFGGALGTLVTGIFLIQHIGLDRANYLCGTFSLIVGVLAILIARRLSPKPLHSLANLMRQKGYIVQLKDRFQLSTKLKGIEICILLSGFSAIGYELVWTRYLSLPLANTRYTYTMILTVFLLGISLGSLLFRTAIDKVKNGLRMFAILQLIVGTTAYELTPIVYFISIKFRHIPILFDFLTCSILMLTPTLFIGVILPSAVKIAVSNIPQIGYSTGRIYSANTLGNILGAVIVGLALLPLIGIKYTLSILVGVNFLIGMLYLFKDSNRSLTTNFVIFALIFLVLLTRELVMKVDIPADFLSSFKKSSERITLIKEGLESTIWVTVNDDNGQKSLWSNQTVLGRTRPNEPYGLSPQSIAGHIPMLLYKGTPRSALGICLGTGQTFSSMLLYDIIEMDVVEISKTVVDIAKAEFSVSNRGLLNDPRVKIIIDDGRSFVTHSKKKYDIITLEPSPPEEAGIVNLYTKEFYQLCSERLNSNGIMSQWLPLYNTHPDETASIAKTFISVFPESILWYNASDLILLGFKDNFTLDPKEIDSKLKETKISKELQVSYLGKGYDINKPNNLLACFLMGSSELRRFSESGTIITDNKPILEYRFIRYEGLENRSEWFQIYNAESIMKFLSDIGTYLSISDSTEIERIRSMYISRIIADAYNRLAVSKAGDSLDEAISFCKIAQRYDPCYGIVYANLGSFYMEKGQLTESISAYERSVNLMPEVPEAWHNLGKAYWISGSVDKAIISLEKAVSVKPDYAEAYNDLGVAYASMGNYERAIDAYIRATEINPGYADAYYNMGLAYEAISNLPKAISAYKSAIKTDPDHVQALNRLRTIIH